MCIYLQVYMHICTRYVKVDIYKCHANVRMHTSPKNLRTHTHVIQTHAYVHYHGVFSIHIQCHIHTCTYTSHTNLCIHTYMHTQAMATCVENVPSLHTSIKYALLALVQRQLRFILLCFLICILILFGF